MTDFVPQPAVAPAKSRTFSLATMMLIVTLVAVGLGLFVTAPGLGILYTIALIPVLVRTMVGIRKRAADGKVLQSKDKFQLFATSIAVTAAASVVAYVAFIAAFFSMCYVYGAFKDLHMGFRGKLFYFCCYACPAILALAAFGGVFYLFRTGRKKK